MIVNRRTGLGDFAAPKACGGGAMLMRVAEGDRPYHCVKPSGMGQASAGLVQFKIGCDPTSASCVGPAAPSPPPFLGPYQTPEEVIAATKAASDQAALTQAGFMQTGWLDSLAAWVNSSSSGNAPDSTGPSPFVIGALVIAGIAALSVLR